MGRTSLLNVTSAVALAGMASPPRRITVRRTILINTSPEAETIVTYNYPATRASWQFDTNREFGSLHVVVPATRASLIGPGPVVAGGMVYVNPGYGGFRWPRGQRAARVRLGHAAMRGVAMRACMLFLTGLLVGVGLHTVAAQGPNNTPNKGLVQVNHIGMNVPNLDEAVTFYTKTMGFPEAFRVNDEKGQARLVYVQVSKNTFFEIQPGPGRPAAINHVGIHVENMKEATA